MLGNYNITNAGADFTINKKNATWTIKRGEQNYGDADPSPLTTGSGIGFLESDSVTTTYSRTSGENASPPTYQITATLSAGVSGALNNYNVTNVGAEFTTSTSVWPRSHQMQRTRPSVRPTRRSQVRS